MITFLRTDVIDFMGLKGKHKIILDLKPGVYFVTGDNRDNPRMGANGCGKSTMFEAIYWCFTGQLMDITVPGADVEPWGGTKRLSVTNWFEIDDQYYGLMRQRKPNGLFLKEGEDGEWRKVDELEVRQMIGLSSEALKRTILLGQHVDLFLDLKPTEQSKFFSDILNLDLWMEASKIASERSAAAVRELRTQQEEMTRAQSRADTLSEQIAAERRSEDGWRTTNEKKRHDAHNEFKLAEKDWNAAKKKLAQLRKPSDLGEAMEKLQAEIKELQGKRTELMREESRRKTDNGKTLHDHKRWTEEKERLVNAQKTKVCTECGQTVTLKHITDKLRDVEAKLANHQHLLADDKQALHDLNEQIADLDDEIETLSGKLEPQLRKHQEDLLTYKSTQRDLDDAATKVTACERRLEDLTEENPHSAAIKRLDDQMRDANAQVVTAKLAVTKANEKAEIADELERIFKEIRLQLIDEVLAELEITAGDAAERLGLVGWRIKFSTEKELKSGGTSVALTTMIYPPGVEKGINWKIYSGGERQRWQLAVTFGLAEVLLARAGLESNVEVLDEPSQGTSAEGVSDLIEYLSERARQQHKAIFYVDHHVLDRGIFDHVWQVVRENGSGRLEVLS